MDLSLKLTTWFQNSYLMFLFFSKQGHHKKGHICCTSFSSLIKYILLYPVITI